MKKYLIAFVLLLSVHLIVAQVQDGTFTVVGAPNLSQSVTIMEAGLNDSGNIDTSTIPELSFVLNPTYDMTGTIVVSNSEQNCETVYLYKVFIHTVNAAAGVIVKAKTDANSGQRFPLLSTYDGLPPAGQYFGERDLFPETNGADVDGYITIPNDATQAIKVFEFKGCRENIPVDFRLSPDVSTPSGSSSFQVVYTITATAI